jgi:hypothetical protein
MALMLSIVAWSSGESVAAAGDAAAVAGVEYMDLFAQAVVVLSVGVEGKVCEALEYTCVAPCQPDPLPGPPDPPPGFVLPLLLILLLHPFG